MPIKYSYTIQNLTTVIILSLILLGLSCGTHLTHKSNRSEIKVIKASISPEKYPYYVIKKDARIDAHGYLFLIVNGLDIVDSILPRECYKEDYPFVDLQIEKKRNKKLRLEELNQVLQDSFGFIIEKEDYWLEKFNLSLADSTQLIKVFKLQDWGPEKNNSYRFSREACAVIDVDDLDDILRRLFDIYCPNGYYVMDTIPKKGVTVKDVNARKRSEFRKYNNEILALDVQYSIMGELNNFLLKRAEDQVPELEGDIEYLVRKLTRSGIKVEMEVERKTRYILKCLR